MAIKLRRSAVPGSVPTTSTLAFGELALNTYDGKIYFKKNQGGLDSIVTISPGGQGGGSALEVSLVNAQSTITNSLSAVSALRFDTDSGFSLTDLGGGQVKIGVTSYRVANSSFKYITVAGQSQLAANGSDTLNLIAGAGVKITTNANASPQSLTISAPGTVIKTFNILGPFWAPVAGTSSFFVTDQTVLRSVQLTNGVVVSQPLMAGLYRNGQLLGFYTLPGGSQNISINTTDIVLFTNDNLTVSIVSGNGNNFSFMLLNISR